MNTATVAERPELVGPAWDRTQDTLPEYNHHGDVLNEYWPRLTGERPRDTQGRGVSAAAVRAMGEIARRHDLDTLIAAARPSRKDRYPLVPIERYACWRRPDGRLFDPGCASTSASEPPS